MAVTENRTPSGDKIQDWLESSPDDPVPLIMWLQGKRLPPIAPGVEPHQFLQRCLSGDRRLSTERDRLAPLLAVILDRIRTEDLLGKISHPGDFIYNLGMFCAFVSRPTILSEPLHALILSLGDAKGWGDLQRRAIRIAVHHNDDGRFKAMWKQMAEDKYHPFFGAEIRDAVRGLIWSHSDSGLPDWSALGPAFYHYALQLESGEYDRRLEFRHLVMEAEQVFQAMPRDQWNAELLDAAERYRWPRWAVETLPTLLMQVGDNTYETWQPSVTLFESILELDAEHDRSRPSGVAVLRDERNIERSRQCLVTVTVAEQTRMEFLAIADFMEDQRLQMKPWKDTSVESALEAIQRVVLENHRKSLRELSVHDASKVALKRTIAASRESYPTPLQKRQYAESEI